MQRSVFALALLTVTLALHAGEPLAGAAFSDGKNRSLSDLGDQTVVVMYFCGHCPRAGAYMRTQAKAIHDVIESEHAPARLVCLTPDLTATELVEWTKERGLDGALVGQDTHNEHQVSTNNIFQSEIYRGGKRIGRLDFAPGDVAAVKSLISAKDAGTFTYPVDGLSDPRATEVWWMVERNKPQAMETLMAARKNKALKDDAEKIYGVVEASLNKRQDALLAGDVSMATYEGLETLLVQAKPVVLKPATEKLKELGKDATIKNELKARAIYQQCQEMLAHPNPQKQQAGREGLETLAKKYGDTVYGKKAGGG
ncbi:MAG: hypothetical protein H0W78_04200 [Planctomycetes bacterium]|nr:hypothetical protein [Planctomycetota bacterium]